MVARCRMSQRCRMLCRIGMCVSGICTGITVFFLFWLVFLQYHATIWGAISGIFAAICLVVNVLEYRSYWKTHLKMLRAIYWFGILTSIVAYTGFVVYVALAIYTKEGIKVYGNSLWMGSVWTSMTLKWTGMLAWHSRSYLKAHMKATREAANDAEEMTSPSGEQITESPNSEERQPMVEAENKWLRG